MRGIQYIKLQALRHTKKKCYRIKIFAYTAQIKKVSEGLDSKKTQSYIDLGRMVNVDIIRCYLYQENVTKEINFHEQNYAYKYIQKPEHEGQFEEWWPAYTKA